jgi:hypothetical protein
MNYRSDRIYRQQTQQVDGLEIDPDHGYLSVIIPEATINLCTNPSFEYGVTTGWAAANGTAALTYNWQAHGAAGYAITPNASQEARAAYGPIALTAGTTYTASVTIQGDPGKIYYIKFTDNAGSPLSTRKWIATGLKQRIHVTYTAAASANYYIYITRDAKYADTRPYYLDGLQVEAKTYPTTYTDGDQVGFVVGETPYLWTGTPGASTSTRSVITRAGGREMNLLNYGFHLLTIIGLGMAGLVDQFLPMPGLGGLPQGTGTTVRDFQVVGTIYGSTPRHISAIRDDLIDAFKPDATIKPQPLVLRYQHCDEDGVADSESLDIQCKFLQGMEGNTGLVGQENLALAFRQYVPFIANTYTQGIELGYQTTVTNANGILMRDVNGIWGAMATGLAGAVNVILPNSDGSVYAGGGFTNITDANGDGITKWNGTAFSSLATGVSGGSVNALALSLDGSLYVGGGFSLAGGVANTAHIAKWDGAAWSALGTGMSGGIPIVWTIAIGPDGSLYAGGQFNLAGGVANTAYIAKWNGVTWSPLGTGMNGNVYALAFGKDGTLYAGGNFTSASGVANTAYIAKWNGVTWSPLGAGMNGTVRSLVAGPDGTIYVGGDFTSASNGVMPMKIYHIVRWSGSAWYPLGAGLNSTVYAMCFGKDKNLYVSGTFSVSGFQSLPGYNSIWTGSTWMPMDVVAPGVDSIMSSVIFDKVGNLYVGFNGLSASGSAISATVIVPDLGSAMAYPIIKFIGPGILYQLKNYSTNQSIFFNLTLLAGETAVLNLDPFRPSFVSSFRGDIWGSAILPGSDLDFKLMPGTNNISTYIYGSTSAATHIVMYYQPLYWSLDGAILK